jgi:metal-sulfur cluster biosynthetic enzyme
MGRNSDTPPLEPPGFGHVHDLSDVGPAEVSNEFCSPAKSEPRDPFPLRAREDARPPGSLRLPGEQQKLDDVWSSLGTVTDPEIDEPVTSLEFVTKVEIDKDDRVEIEFRLPTYWCAPNFAFLMASDMRDSIAELDWVKNVSVKLLDHFSAELINQGVAQRQNFRDAFPGETDDDLDAIREKFLRNAFERRQELLLRHLLKRGYPVEQLVRMCFEKLMELPLDPDGDSLRNLYGFSWQRLRQKNVPLDVDSDLSRAVNHEVGVLAFCTPDGNPLPEEDLKTYLRKIAVTRRNAQFNGFICQSLLASRKERER